MKLSLLSETMKVSLLGAVNGAMAGSASKVWILWDELLLTLVNFPPSMEEENLTFSQKSLVGTGRDKKTEYEKVLVYEKIFRRGVPVVKTHQGYWRKILMWSMKKMLQVEFVDLRDKDLIPLAQPGLMKGFRFSQEQLTREALSANCSGMIGAPTRYGKSSVLRNILRAYPGVQSVVMAPGKSLLKQTVTEMREHLPDREIKLIGGGSKVRFQSEDITVCSMDSVHLIDPGPVRLVIVDEPHAIASGGRSEHLPRFSLARKYAVGATLKGRYDGRDFLLEGLFGPVLANRTYPEAVKEGAICPIRVCMIRMILPRVHCDRDRAMEDFVYRNGNTADIIRKLVHDWIPKEDQTLLFIKRQTQAEFLQEKVTGNFPIVMDKILSGKERDKLTRQVEENHLSRVFCSDIFVQGVTFHELRYLINCSGGGSSTSTIQKPGRLAEVRPGKKHGVMVDFLYEVAPRAKGEPPSSGGMAGVKALARESKARLDAYKEIGYDVSVMNPEHVEDWIENNDTSLVNKNLPEEGSFISDILKQRCETF